MDLKDRTAMPLWCGVPPAGESDPEQIPVITPYAPPVWKDKHCALVIFPGGGYCALAQYEGYGFAEYFCEPFSFSQYVSVAVAPASEPPSIHSILTF